MMFISCFAFANWKKRRRFDLQISTNGVPLLIRNHLTKLPHCHLVWGNNTWERDAISHLHKGKKLVSMNGLWKCNTCHWNRYKADLVPNVKQKLAYMVLIFMNLFFSHTFYNVLVLTKLLCQYILKKQSFPTEILRFWVFIPTCSLTNTLLFSPTRCGWLPSHWQLAHVAQL